MDYRTSDGSVFNTSEAAQSYENNQAASNARANAMAYAAREGHLKQYNEVVRAFNAGNWDLVISLYEKYRSSIDMEIAYIPRGEPERIVSTAKQKIWERKNGRAMSTEADKTQFKNWDNENKIADCEKEIIKVIKEFENGHSEQVMSTWILANNWEKLTGRKMTSAEQIRIAGKSFPEDRHNIYKGSSESSTICGNKGKSKFGVVIIIIAVLLALYFGKNFIMGKIAEVLNKTATEQTTVEE